MESIPPKKSLNNEKQKSVSYFELFKYGNTKEKVMTVIGVIASCIKGTAIPLM